jgi:predicted P-loop ATPase
VRASTDGLRIWLDADEAAALASASEQYQVVHPWEERLSGWLAGRPRCSLAEAMSEGLGIVTRDQRTSDAAIVTGLLRRAGWSTGPRIRIGSTQVRPWYPPGTPADGAPDAPSLPLARSIDGEPE